jgi:hypothetical protein
MLGSDCVESALKWSPGPGSDPPPAPHDPDLAAAEAAVVLLVPFHVRVHVRTVVDPAPWPPAEADHDVEPT